MTDTAERILRADIIENTWLGVVAKLGSIFSKHSKVNNRDIQIIPTADVDDFEYLQQQKGGPLELPIIVVAPFQVAPDPNSYNSWVMRREGYAIQFDEDRANWIILKLAPVLITFQIILVTDDVLTLMRMIDRWSSTELWGFKIKIFGQWEAKIQVVADKNLQVPPRTKSSGDARQFRLSTTLQAKSYSGHIWQVPSIRKTQLDILIPKMGSIDAAMEDPSMLAQIVNSRTIDSNPANSEVIFEPID
jgi:hypothetical protein